MADHIHYKFHPSLSLKMTLFPKFLTGLFLTVAFFHLVGCESTWNYINQPTLKRDVVELFKSHGVVLNNPHCQMVGTSRSAICELHLTPEQVTLMIKGLNLKEVKLEYSPGENPWTKIPESKKGCLTSKFFQGVKKVNIYLSERRSPELRLKSGSAFEYFILFQDLETDRVCIQISYAYG